MSIATTPQQVLSVSSSLSLPRHVTSRIENLVEYSTVPDSAVVQNTVPPVISPYNVYRKIGSLQTLKYLISSRRPPVKEYVQSSKLDKCDLPASSQEQYVTLTIPPEFIASWKQEGYTHLHFGAIRLVLSYTGRK